MERDRLQALVKAKGGSAQRGRVRVNIETDLAVECRFVDYLLARSLKQGRCAKILRSFMVMYQAGVPQRADGIDHLFDPEAVCETIRVLEGLSTDDLTKGPFIYEKGPLAGLYKKHFFQPSFLPNNILAEIQREGPAIIYRKFSQHYGERSNYEGKPFTEADAELIAEAFSKDAIERRAARRSRNADGGLTGEHLIYARLPNRKVYLYTSFHGESPERIADCIRVSAQDFPELQGVAPVFGPA